MTTWQTYREIIEETFFKLTPRYQFKYPVLFILYLCGWGSLIYTIVDGSSDNFWFNVWVTLLIWITLFLANSAETLAENQLKRDKNFLKKSKTGVVARVLRHGREFLQPAENLVNGELVVCEATDIIPADGEIVEGIATIDESAITGESAPVIRESGSDRSAVTAGTKVLGDRIVIKVTSQGGENFINKIIERNKGATRSKTSIEKILNAVLFALSITFALTMLCFYFVSRNFFISLPFILGIYVCLIPSSLCALISAASISSINRLCKQNLITKTGEAVETAGNVDVLFLDKTGTITLGNREAMKFIPATGYTERQLAEIAQFASIPDDTAEGRSIVILAKNKYGLRVKVIENLQTKPIPFSPKTRMSGVDFFDEQGQITFSARKGAIDAIKEYVEGLGGSFPSELVHVVDSIVHQGGTPLAVCEFSKVIGIVHLKDMVKKMSKKRFYELRQMGIRSVMITGDNSQTAAAIAAEAGVDDFVAEATPEMKLNLIKKEQNKGKLVAMSGDDSSDAPALAQADIGLAMNTGVQSIREASNMIDLENNPTKLIEAITMGKQMMMTWGALMIATIASLFAKYVALIPAFFINPSTNQSFFDKFNFLHLHSAKSAVLSCNIFNMLFLFVLIPLALKGINYQFLKADTLFKKNLFLYGGSALILPFFAIKLIDSILHLIRMV